MDRRYVYNHLLEPLIDLIHGDVVLNDRCCRHVADLFVCQNDQALRQLTSSRLLPDCLEKAMDIYCLRRLLIQAPEAVLRSAEVGDALEHLGVTMRQGLTELHPALLCQTDENSDDVNSFCQQLQEEGGALLTSAGCTIGEEVPQLRKHMETSRYALLLASLDDAVVGYIMCAAVQSTLIQRLQLEDGAPWVGIEAVAGSLQCCLCQFANSAVAHRAEALQAAAVERELVFQGLISDIPDRRLPAAMRSHNAEQHGATLPPNTQPSFCGDVEAVISSSPPPNTPENTPPRSKRRLRHTRDDAIVEAYNALTGVGELPQQQRSASPGPVADVSSLVIVDTSGNAADQPRSKKSKSEKVMIASSETSLLQFIEGNTEAEEDQTASAVTSKSWSNGTSQCIRRQGAQERRYFFCPSTGRFEPYSVRGFFVRSQHGARK